MISTLKTVTYQSPRQNIDWKGGTEPELPLYFFVVIPWSNGSRIKTVRQNFCHLVDLYLARELNAHIYPWSLAREHRWVILTSYITKFTQANGAHSRTWFFYTWQFGDYLVKINHWTVWFLGSSLYSPFTIILIWFACARASHYIIMCVVVA